MSTSPASTQLDITANQTLEQSVLEGLNPEQREAVMATAGPLLIIAGAGTGKTKVITHRIAYLVSQGLAETKDILALTFTDKAAEEMETRVDQLLPMGYLDAWIMTFHAFGDKVLRENALEMGLSPDFKVMAKAEQVLFLQQHLFGLDLNYYRPLSNPAKFLDGLASFFSRCKDECISPQQYQEWVDGLRGQESGTRNQAESRISNLESDDSDALIDEGYIARQQELATAYARYEDFKTQANVMDFGDQVVKVVDLFHERPDILRTYQARFQYILVDEFQDTNYAQNLMVQMLAGAHTNLCVVGDDDQSIYKFRGAAISNILKFQSDFPGARQIVLTQNYRSSQTILDAAYRLIQHNNPDRLEVANQIDKHLVSAEKVGGNSVEELFGQTLSEEADAVVQKIKERMAEAPYQFKDVALLVRSNSQAAPFIQAFNYAGIPFKFSGASGLYERPEIKLLLSFLNTIGHASDDMSLFHLASSQLYIVPMVDLLAIMDLCAQRHQPLLRTLGRLDELPDTIELTAEGKQELQRVVEDVQWAMDLSRNEEVGRVLYLYLARLNYLTSLEQAKTQESVESISNIAKFFDRIKQFNQASSDRSVRAFVDYIDLLREAGDDPTAADLSADIDAVNILTIHAAKGLEFPVVFMVNLVSSRFPSTNRPDMIALPDELIRETLPTGDFHRQEERRLFYVGVTRAKDWLYLAWGKDYGGKRETKVSPYLTETLGQPSQVPLAEKMSPITKIHQFGGQLQLPLQSEPAGLDLSGVKLTPHKVNDYEDCAKLYQYKYVWNLHIPKHHSMVYGSAIHTALEAFYVAKMQDQVLELDQMLEVFEQVWSPEGFLSEEHERERLIHGRQMLTEFWQREKDNPHKPKLMEENFHLTFDDVVVTGRFDRVDEDAAGKVTLLDYKTSERVDQKQADQRAKDSVQLAIYALAYQRRYGVMPDRVGLLFVETNVFGSYAPDDKTLESATSQILTVASGIKQREYFATPSQQMCSLCPFNTICPDAFGVNQA